ncbi:hypothetical protein M422DRAFT_246261 [Sphaerobolus stellatus SS14]|nr:hypothetical protein M422DRAFT_246261 [Sphaerobolus stellatus SS14]
MFLTISEVFDWDENHYEKIGPGAVDVETQSLYGTRLHLPHVCHRWKRVLYQCSAVWTTIVIAPWVSVSTVKHALHLSNARMLDVYLFGPCKFESSGTVDQSDDATRTIDLILPCLPRIGRLALMYDPHTEEGMDRPKLLLQFPMMQGRLTLPSLKSLYIEFTVVIPLASFDISTLL